MNSLDKVLLWGKDYTKITVVGPHRSGTTISTEIIAKELGYTAFLEESFGVYDWTRYLKLIHGEEPAVIQAPGLSCWCQLMEGGVVLMRRRVDRINDSQDRIPPKWNWDWGGRC